MDSPDALCAFLVSIGSSCAPCPDGQSYCLDVLVTKLTGGVAFSGPLQARGAAQISSAPNCN